MKTFNFLPRASSGAAARATAVRKLALAAAVAAGLATSAAAFADNVVALGVPQCHNDMSLWVQDTAHVFKDGSRKISSLYACQPAGMDAQHAAESVKVQNESKAKNEKKPHFVSYRDGSISQVVVRLAPAKS